MSTKRPTITAVKFHKEGIRVVFDDGLEMHAGDPITVTALGTGIQDDAAYTVIKFKNRNGRWQIAAVRSSLLTAKINDFTAELTDRHYRWPNRKYVPFVIDALAAKNPEKRIAITMVPGWHGSTYVHPHEVIKRDGDDREYLLADNPNVRLGEYLCRGTLEEWKTEVARYCCLSSRLRLAIGAPFAATILRKIGLDTFGFHFVGDTSSGKTLGLRVGGSVPGFNSEAGPTSWDGTSTGFEQLALGSRDNLMPLDDTDAIEGDKKMKAQFVKLSMFKLSKNQQKLRAGHYARANSVNSDSRNIILSSGEDILIEGRRVRGQDVRMIHIPACISDFQDIFDAHNASSIVGKTVEEREDFVSKLEHRTRKFQGVAQLAFLRQLINDNNADKTLARYMDEFILHAPLSQSRKVFARLRRRIAAVYAGSALAIDYKILPFRKKETLQALRKCMNDGIDLLIANEVAGMDSSVSFLSDEQLVANFCKRLSLAKFVKAGRYAKRAKHLTVQDIEAADAFIKFDQPGKFRAMIPTSQMEAWYPDKLTRNRLVSLLRKRKIFGPGRQADTSARQIMIKPYPTKIPCYCVFLKAFKVSLADLDVS